jgi:hypothetical protein
MLQAYGIPLKHVPLETQRAAHAEIIREIIMQKEREIEIEIEVTEPEDQ